MKLLSKAQWRVLDNLINHRDPWQHIRGASAHGGSHRTLNSLVNSGYVGYLDNTLYITPSGRGAYKEANNER